MQGPVVQVFALVLHGNRFLQAGKEESFSASGSAFQFCDRVSFVTPKEQDGGTETVPYASDPEEWLCRLRGEGTLGLRAHYVRSEEKGDRDRMTAGFVGGGGRWLIEAVRTQGCDFWEGHWAVGDRNRPDNRSWRVTYERIATGWASPELETHPLSRVAAALEAALVRIRDFAARQDEKNFAAAFERSLSLLRADNPMAEVYHKDLVPEGVLSLESQRLLAASQEAWVFGGMGSWNDISFSGEDGTLYESLSEDLFRLLTRSAMEAVNTSYKAKQPWWKVW